MKKVLLSLMVISSSYIAANFKVTSSLRIDNKTSERIHYVSDGEHVVYPNINMILDATVSSAATRDGKDEEYAVHLKVVRRTGATVTEKFEKAKWGESVKFECPVDGVEAVLEMTVTQEEVGSRRGAVAPEKSS